MFRNIFFFRLLDKNTTLEEYPTDMFDVFNAGTLMLKLTRLKKLLNSIRQLAYSIYCASNANSNLENLLLRLQDDQLAAIFYIDIIICIIIYNNLM
jgi:hypothetical protein